MRPTLPAFLLVAAILAPVAPAQDPTYKSGAGEVLVDVVVRDKRGKIPKQLKASDFTVLENGVPQSISSFRFVSTEGAKSADKEPALQTTDVKAGEVRLQRQIRLVSLVFENLDAEGRRNARVGALDFLNADHSPNVYYAVFYVGRVFQPVLNYTNDRDRIKAAIDRVTLYEKSPSAATQDVGMTRGPGPVVPADATPTESRGPNFQATLNAAADFNYRMDVDMFGSVNLFGLWGVVDELGRLPGRKAVLYFSPGFRIPYNYRHHYHSMISTANRANVTFYTIDTRGMYTVSDLFAGAADLKLAVQTSNQIQAADPVDGGSTGFGSTELAMERAVESTTASAQQNLLELAERTGGFLISNTNDFRGPMRKLSEEFNTYYELTYRSADANYDGRFRTIEVKSQVPGVSIQARNGYFAIPALSGLTVFPFEAPLLRTLGEPTLPRDIPFQSRVLLFTAKDGLRRASLVLDLPLEPITFVKSDTPEKSKAFIAFLALVKDEQGQVVAKLSRDLPFEVPTVRVTQFCRGRSTFTRPLALRPGRYTVESAIVDNLGGKRSAKKSVLIVPEAGQGPVVSDLALVRRVDPLPDPADPNDPLIAPAGKVVPTLEDKFIAGPGGQIAAYLSLHPDPSAPAPQLFLDFIKDGKLVRREQPKIPEPQGGAIPLIATIKTYGLPPGPYELRAALVQGDKATARSLPLTIE